jgi:tetratricopeptide (TPR) repeat protein
MSAIWTNFRDRQLARRYAILICLSSLVMGIHGCSFGGKVGIGPVTFKANTNLGSSPTASQETVEKVSLLLQDANQKVEQRDFSGAIANLDRAIAIVPEEAMPYYYRGTVYLGAGNLTIALANFEQALKIQPNSLQFKKCRLLTNALIKVRRSDVQGSRSDFDELIKLDPRDGRSYYRRGSLYREIGNEAAAIADFEQALKLQPDLAQAKKALEQHIQ